MALTLVLSLGGMASVGSAEGEKTKLVLVQYLGNDQRDPADPGNRESGAEY